MPNNPCHFSIGDTIINVYTGWLFSVVEPNKKGMAKLKDDHGNMKVLNACNNPQFIKVEIGQQLKLL